jgi:hypothetical protein
MSNRRRTITIAGSGVLAAVVAVGLQLGAGATASGSPQPRAAQTIDAKTDPTGAGKALDFCSVISNCSFVKTAGIVVKYDAPRVIGDALYNCGKAEAEDIVAISDERSESTSLEESVSVKASLGFLGLAKASVEAEVKSKQLDEVATKLTQTNAVSVAPGTIGSTESRVPTAYLDGDAHVTNGVNLITVTNLELTYPGFGAGSINKVDWTSRHKDMTAQDRQDHCAGLPPVYPTGTARGSRSPSRDRFVICTGKGGGCAGRRVMTGVDPPPRAGTKLTLARGRQIYATGTAGRRGGVLYAHRQVRAGPYTLLLSGPHDTTMLQVTVRRG